MQKLLLLVLNGAYFNAHAQTVVESDSTFGRYAKINSITGGLLTKPREFVQRYSMEFGERQVSYFIIPRKEALQKKGP